MADIEKTHKLGKFNAVNSNQENNDTSPSAADTDTERAAALKGGANNQNSNRVVASSTAVKPIVSVLKKTKLDTARSATARSEQVDEDDFWDETTRYAGPLTDDETGNLLYFLSLSTQPPDLSPGHAN